MFCFTNGLTSGCCQFIYFCTSIPWVSMLLLSSVVYLTLHLYLLLSCLVGQILTLHEPCHIILFFCSAAHLITTTFSKYHINKRNLLCQTIQVYPKFFNLKFIQFFQTSDTQHGIYLLMYPFFPLILCCAVISLPHFICHRTKKKIKLFLEN